MNEEVTNKKILENVLASFEMDSIKVPDEVINKVMKELNIQNEKNLVLKSNGGN